jgi:hypothetical protein
VELLAFPINLSEKEAISFLRQQVPEVDVSIIDYVYYPYLFAKLSILVYTKITSKETSEDIVCFVDMVNGKETVTGDNVELSPVTVDERRIIPAKYTLEDASRKAITYVSHIYVQTVKTASIPRISLVSEQLSYKLFWLLKCNDGENTFYLIMDSINGQYHMCYL